MKELPVRKDMRLKGHDYSGAGYYFITVCVKDRYEILWDGYSVVGAAIGRPQLSEIGQLVDVAIKKIEHIYNSVKIEKYIIMPNHVHMIIRLSAGLNTNGRPMAAPTISRIINQFKGSISKRLGYSIWQKLFYDQIIRDEAEYRRIWKYIDENPSKWAEDCYYPAQ